MVNERTSIPLPRTRVVHFSCRICEQMHWIAQEKWFGCVFIKVCSIWRAIHSNTNSRDIYHISRRPPILVFCLPVPPVSPSRSRRLVVPRFIHSSFFLFYRHVFSSILLHCGWGKSLMNDYDGEAKGVGVGEISISVQLQLQLIATTNMLKWRNREKKVQV